MEEKKTMIGCRVSQDKAQRFKMACVILKKSGQAILEKAIDRAIKESEQVNKNKN